MPFYAHVTADMYCIPSTAIEASDVDYVCAIIIDDLYQMSIGDMVKCFINISCFLYSFEYNRIDDAGARALADCLKHCAIMKELKWAYKY